MENIKFIRSEEIGGFINLYFECSFGVLAMESEPVDPRL